MTNVEHLLENGLTAADKAFKDDKDCAVAFQEEMNTYYNQMMLNDVAVTQDELWEMVQYIKFVREVDAWTGGRREMTDREKLARLLMDSPTLDVMFGETMDEWYNAADYLISKGVTIPVRCGECKHSTLPSKQTQIYGEKGTLTCHNKYAPSNRRNVNERDFCSYGERREDETN